MIVGFLVNKFRGDASLFDDGMRLIAERTGWRALRPHPVFRRRRAAAGRGRVGLDSRERRAEGRGHDRRADALRASPISTISIRCGSSPTSRLVFVRARRAAAASPISSSSPARKATIADLALLSRARLGHRSLRPCPARRAGARALRRLSDARAGASPTPTGIEGPAGEVAGPRPARRRDDPDAATRRCAPSPAICLANGAPFAGYEMHIGRTTGRIARGRCCASPTAATTARSRRTGASWAPMSHGLFADDAPARRLPRRARGVVRPRLRGDGRAYARRARRPSRTPSRSATRCSAWPDD